MPCSSRSLASTRRANCQPELESSSSGPSTLNDQPLLDSASNCQDGDITKMIEMFPHLSEDQLKFLVDLSANSFSCAIDCALDGPSLESLRSLAVRQLNVPLEESPRIRLDIDDSDQDWVEAALAFYKQNKFNKQARVRITIRGQPGIDTGGVRRQFFFGSFFHACTSFITVQLF